MLPPLDELLSGFDAGLPLEQAHTIPASWYLDPRLYAAEREHVFGNSWQCVGRADQVAEQGMYLTADIAGEPVVVVRGTDGILHGFFNVCQHRASPILSEEQGHCGGKLRCRYHGWTYDLEGRLRGTPEFEGVCNFRKEDNGLVPVRTATWGPFVWAHLDSTSTATLAQYLHPLSQCETTSGAIGNLGWHRRISYDLACNWKVYVDNYLDGGYHVNTVHPALADVIDYREYRTDLHENCSVQRSPLRPAGGAVGSTRTGDAAYWWVFPNFMINIYAGVMDTNLVLPVAADRCRVIFDFYFARDTDAAFIRDSIAVAEQVQAEDILICEQVQRGLASRSYNTGRFSVKRENGSYHFHQLLARRLNAKRPEA